MQRFWLVTLIVLTAPDVLAQSSSPTIRSEAAATRALERRCVACHDRGALAPNAQRLSEGSLAEIVERHPGILLPPERGNGDRERTRSFPLPRSADPAAKR